MNAIKTFYLSFGKKYPKLGMIFETLFLFALGVYLFCQMILSTTFPVSFLFGMAGLVAQLLQVSVILKAGLQLQEWKHILCAAAVALAYYLVYRTIDLNLLLFYAWILVGMVGVSYRKVLKLHVIVVGLILFSAILASLTGAIQNLVYLETEGFRDSFGICYPTDFASYLFYLLLFFWMAWEKLPDWLAVLLNGLVLAVSAGLCHSDTCMLCCIAFFGVLFIRWGMEKWSGKPFVKMAERVLGLILPLAFPLCAALMFGLIALYGAGTGIGRLLNEKLTGRLYLAWTSLSENGIHPFGAVISMKGRGFTTFPVDGYNFVDSTYPLLLVKYGYVLFAVIAVLWVWTSFRAVRSRDYRLAFGMGLIALHSLAEHHFVEIYYNILLVMPFACYQPAEESVKTDVTGKKTPEENMENGGIRGWKIGIVLGVCAAFAVSAPLWLSDLRTVRFYLQEKEASHAMAAVIAALFFLLCVIVMLSAGIIKGIGCIQKKSGKKDWIRAAVLSALACLLLFGGSCGMHEMVSSACRACDGMIRDDEPAMELICGYSEGRISVSHVPSVYRRKYPQIRYDIFMGEDLARFQDQTVIVPRGSDFQLFFRRGFLYFPISEGSAVYTNEHAVIQALEDAGYVGTAYYPEVRSLKNGDTGDFVKGSYTVRCRLHVEKQGEDAEKIAAIRIFGKGGKEILLQEVIGSDRVQMDGAVDAEFPISFASDNAGIVFYLLPEGGCSFAVEEFSIQMTP